MNNDDTDILRINKGPIKQMLPIIPIPYIIIFHFVASWNKRSILNEEKASTKITILYCCTYIIPQYYQFIV